MSTDIIRLTISAAQSGQRLDKFLHENKLAHSRSLAAKLVQSEQVLVNDRKVKASYTTRENDRITFIPPEKTPTSLTPFDYPLEILFEDQDVIVLVKPAGLVVHPAQGHTDKTLVNALLFHTQDLSMGTNELRPGIVHRLDKETSGVMVVAKNNKAHSCLAQQFKDKTTHRIYQALVYGPIRKIENEYSVENYLIRHPKDRKRFASFRGEHPENSGGKWAATTFKKLIDYNCGLSLIQCQLKTGRTHQIRVHLSELGHPLVGDNLYGSSSRTKNLKSVKLRKMIKSLSRIGLHAKELGFNHPRTNEFLKFEVDWPDDMISLIKELK